MFINIEMDSDIPIYTQLANGLIEGVAGGSLKPGDSLPSVRSLASDLGINMHTVNKAYRELDKKGIIRIIPKSGAVVNILSSDEVSRLRVETAMRPVIAEAMAVGLSKHEITEMMKELFSKIKEERQ
ncbi:GntR family transcriptional regulator [Sporosarcina sp. Marseille-Q4063]|uniref:GntR family transcriptional regulator n=1 Tax=Sporosarcina sp. Marseille-Q4063 TaxID=2810514 RepID=UPI001BAE6C60|nr:GntR family transcriptional regulator [Sporosarcina sp. Marseille-Q4063]QUW22653.1 GntR family transcriptional regulator [Sporosarcina sp. Marseille-Q4063]